MLIAGFCVSTGATVLCPGHERCVPRRLAIALSEPTVAAQWVTGASIGAYTGYDQCVVAFSNSSSTPLERVIGALTSVPPVTTSALWGVLGRLQPCLDMVIGAPCLVHTGVPGALVAASVCCSFSGHHVR